MRDALKIPGEKTASLADETMNPTAFPDPSACAHTYTQTYHIYAYTQIFYSFPLKGLKKEHRMSILGTAS